HDITDGVKYLIEEGIADPERIGIYGGSYGGYATLSGLTFTPDLYSAGVSFVGPSNLITFIESLPAHWAPVIQRWKERVGDPDDPEDRERLIRQSPFFFADQINAPLMVVQGANDPRVKKHESDQIVVRLRDLDHHVEYILAPDEGHGFTQSENRLSFVVALERFFAEYLGGRYQKDVPVNIAQRLEEITVDVASVELHEQYED
ncbi:MAG: alpha/beta hydrolase family protein, partial [Bacteroidota bacterium]